MKKVYSLALLTLFAVNTYAQCNGRYLDEIFTTVTKTTVVYSSVYNLSMDIYTPDGDTATSRPAILLAHGGSFIGGNRNETTIVELCNRFAKRGYVTASMSYRLGGGADMLAESSAYPVVMKAISDGKAAVRYLKLNADTYGVDSNKVIVGGNSAGGILMVHLAWIDDTAEVNNNQIIYNAINDNGGIEGNSGNTGPTSKVFALVDWAGAIKDTSWIDSDDVVGMSLHGDPDGTVPYNCGQVLNGFSQVSVCGPGVYTKRLDNLGTYHVHRRFPGQDHQPWGTNGSGATFDLCDSITTDFLYNRICNASTGIASIAGTAAVSLYPNPASAVVYITSSEVMNNIRIVDLSGKEVYKSTPSAVSCSVSLSDFPAALYTVYLSTPSGTVVRKLSVQ